MWKARDEGVGVERADLQQDWDPPDTRSERPGRRARESKRAMQSSGPCLSLSAYRKVSKKGPGLGMLLRSGGHPMGISGSARPLSSVRSEVGVQSKLD